MILFQREPAHSCFEEAMPLIVNYRREVDYYQDFQLDPEFSKYAELEKAGVVRAYTAREDGTLIGFALFFFTPHLHFRTKIFAMHDILYITPEKRGFGHRFIKWCDEQLAADGADVIFYFVNGNFDYSPVLRKQGYVQSDFMYSRRVK